MQKSRYCVNCFIEWTQILFGVDLKWTINCLLCKNLGLIDAAKVTVIRSHPSNFLMSLVLCRCSSLPLKRVTSIFYQKKSSICRQLDICLHFVWQLVKLGRAKDSKTTGESDRQGIDLQYHHFIISYVEYWSPATLAIQPLT